MEDNVFTRRDRSASNEHFELPPLPDIEDNKDLNDDGEMQNYKSNGEGKSSMFSGLAAVADEDEEFGIQIDQDLKNLASGSVKSAGMFDLGGLTPDIDEEEDLER
jgi:hypothetical protein